MIQEQFTVKTSSRLELVDVTRQVTKVVSASDVKSGIALVFVPHATAALLLNENEPRLVSDIATAIEKLFPRGKGYRHDEIDDNAASHIASATLGSSLTIPVSGGRLDLGTWQSVLLVELDGPRSRRVTVTVLG